MSVQNVRVSRNEEKWEAELSGEISPESLDEHRKHVLQELSRTVELKGFRRGHVPEGVLIQNLGNEEIARRTAEHAVRHELPELFAKEKLNIVDAPQVSIEPLTATKPLIFKARAPLAPEVELSDYKKIAADLNAKRETVSVSDDEHRETVMHLRRERARIEKVEAGTSPQEAADHARTAEEKDLPELNDEFVKTLGYENAADFSDKLREHIRNEKELQERNKRRAALIDALVADSRIRYPAILQEYELDEMESRLISDVERLGRTFEAYLGEVKKTRDELRAEWRDAADKRAKIRLVLAEIARKEHIEEDRETLEHEFEHAKKHYPSASPDALRAHLAHALRNEAVLQRLETLGS